MPTTLRQPRPESCDPLLGMQPWDLHGLLTCAGRRPARVLNTPTSSPATLLSTKLICLAAVPIKQNGLAGSLGPVLVALLSVACLPLELADDMKG